MTQVLPTDDAFTSLGGTTPSLWHRIRPWHTMPTYALGGSEFVFGVFNGTAALYSGHFASARGAVSSTNQDEDPGATPPSDIFPQMAGWAFRHATAQDVSVSARFVTIMGGTEPTDGWARFYGIGARIGGGTLVNSGDEDDECLQLNDGYWFVQFGKKSSPEAGYKLILFRVNAGAVTRLAEDPVGEDVTHGYDGHKFPFLLQMTVEQDVSGDVEIHCYRRAAGAALPDDVGGPITPQLVEIFSVTDTSGSKITAAGEVGFCQSLERDDGTTLSAHACSWISAEDLSVPELMFRDEWFRDQPDGFCRPNQGHSPPDHPGHSLACGWAGDLFSHLDGYQGAGTGPSNKLYLSSGRGRVVAYFDTPATLKHSRRATSEVTHHRSVKVRFLSAGTADTTAPRVIGPQLRIGVMNESGFPPQAQQAYAFFLRYSDDDSEWSAGIYRARPAINPNFPNYDILAFKSGLTGLSFDTDITLDFLIVSEESPHQVQNAAKMTAKIDGTQVVFDAGDTYTDGGSGGDSFSAQVATLGILIEASGTVWDESTLRITSGTGEGLLILCEDNQSPNSRELEVDDWTEEDLSGGGGEPPPENDQASIPVPDGETPDPPSGTLVTPIEWGVTEEVHALSNVHRLDADYVYRGTRAPYQRRRWTVSCGALTDTETDDLIDFWDAHDGTELAFYWVAPDGETVVVHFLQDDLDTVLRGPHATRHSFVLEELR